MGPRSVQGEPCAHRRVHIFIGVAERFGGRAAGHWVNAIVGAWRASFGTAENVYSC